MDDYLAACQAHLVEQTPFLTVGVAGVILSGLFWKRCPLPCFCALVASVFLLTATVGLVAVQEFLMFARPDRKWLSIMPVATTLSRAGAFGLLLIAVFVGRSQRSRVKTLNS